MRVTRSRVRNTPDAEVVDAFTEDLEAHGGCGENITAVCVDMSASYRAGIAAHLPWAEITFDEFHVIQLLNQAVDAVRREEVKANPRLKRSRYLWLKDQQDWTPRQRGWCSGDRRAGFDPFLSPQRTAHRCLVFLTGHSRRSRSPSRAG